MTTAAQPERLRSLDGLRGVAALAVVFHHLFLVSPALAEAVWPIRDTATQTVAWRAVTFPLHLIVSAGLEAVIVFFILSGLVLTLPALNSRGIRAWLLYYPRRLVRLCLPVLASILLAIILLVSVHRYSIPGQEGAWLSSTNSLTLSLDEIGQTLNLLGPLQPLNNPLWSLGWEIVFSLLLPLAVLIAVAVRERPVTRIIIGCACLVTITLGSVLGNGAMTYLPMFLLGSVLAVALPTLRKRFDVAPGAARGRVVAAIPFIVSLVLISVPWILSAIDGHLYGFTIGFAVLGCLLLVLLSTTLAWLRTALTRAPIQWLGRVSFSLYLVHVPIIVTIAYLVGPANWLIYIPVGLVASLLAAWGFYVVAERPSHLLSRRIGRKATPASTEVR
jgi:peptidoglycan/LPS O-acetylase OafA/YrhL